LTRLRAHEIPQAAAGTGARVLVGGALAIQEDTSRSVSQRLPYVIAGVVLTAFALLVLAFGSVLVPIQAAVTNLLSVGAAFGIVALACGGGAFGALVGIPEPTPVPILMPMMLFAILFGLSMDYGVFLLSRVKEEYDRHGDNSLAVATGVARTGRVITASAAIMVAVFGAFVPSQSVLLKMFGLGLATAILVDATLVRMVLVPATMELLGDRNWWLPGWLGRVLPRVRVDRELPVDPYTPSAARDADESARDAALRM
jgi:putative drug exporter of the RND superfamily